MSRTDPQVTIDNLSQDLFARLHEEQWSLEELQAHLVESAEALVASQFMGPEQVLAVLSTLDHETHQSLLLHLEGLSCAQIAQRQTITEETVRKQITRAYVAVRSRAIPGHELNVEPG